LGFCVAPPVCRTGATKTVSALGRPEVVPLLLADRTRTIMPASDRGAAAAREDNPVAEDVPLRDDALLDPDCPAERLSAVEDPATGAGDDDPVTPADPALGRGSCVVPTEPAPEGVVTLGVATLGLV
jgi:hypothetical protein